MRTARVELPAVEELQLAEVESGGVDLVLSVTGAKRLVWVLQELEDRVRVARQAAECAVWDAQERPCSGSGYAHASHGACPGYGTDRT